MFPPHEQHTPHTPHTPRPTHTEDAHAPGRLILPAEDTDAPARVARLQRLGIGKRPIPEFDEFARELARATRAPYAMVNFIDDKEQYFAGLYDHTLDQAMELPSDGPEAEGVGRSMPLDHGYCPYVVQRKAAFPLEHILDYPRFEGNPVVNKLLIQSYLGTPLVDPQGQNLGTVCVVDTEARAWGLEGVELIKRMAQKLVDEIHQRGRWS